MPNSPPAHSQRHDLPDALRACWMLWMAVFHFCFDLAHIQHWVSWNFYRDPVWTIQRIFILGGFLFWAGWGQGLAIEAGQSAQRFWRRWAQIAGAAMLVSLGSAVMFPKSWISFGVLHAFVLLLPIVRWGAARCPSWVLLLLAAACAALPLLVQHPVFDTRWTNWVGLSTRKPITEDHVPLLPWAAPMLLGLVAARVAALKPLLGTAAPRALVVLGRWPLTFYLLHQPILLGALALVSMVRA